MQAGIFAHLGEEAGSIAAAKARAPGLPSRPSVRPAMAAQIPTSLFFEPNQPDACLDSKLQPAVISDENSSVRPLLAC